MWILFADFSHCINSLSLWYYIFVFIFGSDFSCATIEPRSLMNTEIKISQDNKQVKMNQTNVIHIMSSIQFRKGLMKHTLGWFKNTMFEPPSQLEFISCLLYLSQKYNHWNIFTMYLQMISILYCERQCALGNVLFVETQYFWLSLRLYNDYCSTGFL